jgi:predicted nuclease with TOPRIM domain
MTEYPEYDPRDSMELEPLEEEVSELEKVKSDLNTQTERLNYKIYQLKKLAEFNQIESWGMSLNYEQQKEKLEILNMYL